MRLEAKTAPHGPVETNQTSCHRCAKSWSFGTVNLDSASPSRWRVVAHCLQASLDSDVHADREYTGVGPPFSLPTPPPRRPPARAAFRLGPAHRSHLRQPAGAGVAIAGKLIKACSQSGRTAVYAPPSISWEDRTLQNVILTFLAQTQPGSNVAALTIPTFAIQSPTAVSRMFQRQ